MSTYNQRQRIRQASFEAGRQPPPGIGRLVSAELYAWDVLGWMPLAPDSPVLTAVDELLGKEG